MGCRCKERGQAIRQGLQDVARGNIRTAGQQAAFVGRTLVQDVRSGDLARTVARQAARLRLTSKR